MSPDCSLSKYDNLRPGDAKATVVDVTKSGVATGWQPTVLLEDSIRALFKNQSGV